MPRFYLPPNQCQGSTLFLAGREAHHALHVLRLQHRQRVAVVDGAGGEFICEVQSFDRDKIKLAALEKRSIPAPPHQITLLQALPKGKLFESIVQKATELGVFRIVPLLSERVIAAQLDQKGIQQKAEKGPLVAMEPLKNGGSAWVQESELPLPPNHFPDGRK